MSSKEEWGIQEDREEERRSDARQIGEKMQGNKAEQDQGCRKRTCLLNDIKVSQRKGSSDYERGYQQEARWRERAQGEEVEGIGFVR